MYRSNCCRSRIRINYNTGLANGWNNHLLTRTNVDPSVCAYATIRPMEIGNLGWNSQTTILSRLRCEEQHVIFNPVHLNFQNWIRVRHSRCLTQLNRIRRKICSLYRSSNGDKRVRLKCMRLKCACLTCLTCVRMTCPCMNLTYCWEAQRT